MLQHACVPRTLKLKFTRFNEGCQTLIGLPYIPTPHSLFFQQFNGGVCNPLKLHLDQNGTKKNKSRYLIFLYAHFI
jgi:hypothetical protein